MKQGIVIVTSPATRPFLMDLLDDFGNYAEYDVVIHENSPENNEYEMGGIKRMLNAGYDEFFLLHDTVRLLNGFRLFTQAFERYRGSSCSISPGFLSFLGKFRAETLNKMTLPRVFDKKSAVDAETNFLKEYLNIEGDNHIVIYPNFDQHYRFEEIHGRKNMVLESDSLIKYKGTWHPDMIKKTSEHKMPAEKSDISEQKENMEETDAIDD